MCNKRFRAILPLIIVGLLASMSARADSGGLEDYVFPPSSGPNAGKRLIDVVAKAGVPLRAIQDSFAFYDRNRNSLQTHTSMDDLHEGMPLTALPPGEK